MAQLEEQVSSCRRRRPEPRPARRRRPGSHRSLAARARLRRAALYAAATRAIAPAKETACPYQLTRQAPLTAAPRQTVGRWRSRRTGLTKRFGERTALDGVDLHVPRGVRVRLPRPQRRGQDDDDPHAARPHARQRGEHARARPSGARRARAGAASASARSSRSRAFTRTCPAARTCASSPRCAAPRRTRGSSRRSRASGWPSAPTRRSRATRWACASASASRAACWPTRCC